MTINTFQKIVIGGKLVKEFCSDGATIVELGRPLLRLCSDSLNIQILGMPVPLPVRIEILMNANMNKILMDVNMNPS